MNADKLIKTIRSTVVPYRYDFYVKDMEEIHSAVKDDAELMGWCFRFGFLQGQKAAGAEAKREKRQLMQRDTTGWYAYLSRWLERNIDKSRSLRMLGIRARSIENIMIEKEATK